MEYKATNGLILKVSATKSAVILELPDTDEAKANLNFDRPIFNSIIDELDQLAHKIWKNLTPKEADSVGSDYDEYYDRKLGNNGYLSVYGTEIQLHKPVDDNPKAYQFNKRKMEAFLFEYKGE